MDVARAYKIIGSANSCEPFLSNMIKALSMMSWSNTQEENERLEAAKYVKSHKKAYHTYMQTQRNKR